MANHSTVEQLDSTPRPYVRATIVTRAGSQSAVVDEGTANNLVTAFAHTLHADTTSGIDHVRIIVEAL